MTFVAKCRVLCLGTACLWGALNLVGCAPQGSADKLKQSLEEVQLSDDETLKARLDRAIEVSAARTLDPKVQNAWQIVHGMLAFGADLKLNVEENKTVAGLPWLLEGGKMNGWNFRAGDHGLVAILEAGSKSGQGHPDQWLGYMSQIGLPLDTAIHVNDQKYTVADLMSQAQWDIQEGMEATWTLMGLGVYLPVDVSWQSKDGKTWNLERIVAMEAAQSLEESACGGSHRLYGLAVGLNKFKESSQPATGGWLEAQQVVHDAIQTAREFQQPDGCFSANFFSRSATSADIAVRINTTGHTFEFLALAMENQQLKEPWMVRAAEVLCDMLEQTRDMPVECGGLYHAAHGLKIYRERLFGPMDLAASPISPETKTQ